MEHAYSIIMGIFAGALLLYAGLMALSKDYKMIPFRKRVSFTPKDPKRYMFQLSKVIALVALAPGLSALVALLNTIAGVVALFVFMILFIWLGTKIMRGVE